MTNHETIAATLRQRLEDLTQRVGRTEHDLRQPLDPDFEEQAVDLEEHETLEALGAADLDQIRQIKQALTGLEDGTYGTCLKCGEKIAPERLEALPTATECIDCAH